MMSKMVGRVVSTKMTKTATVLVESIKKHPLYKKTFRRSKRFMADNEMGASLGDIVELIKIRPVSKLKHWKIVKIVGKDVEAIVEETLRKQAEEAIEEIMPENPENSENSENQKASESDVLGNSESSEKKKARKKKEK